MTTGFSFGQINNGGFEVWDTVYNDSYSTILSNTFSVPNPYSGIANNWININDWGNVNAGGVSQTSDSHAGNYAVIIHNTYTYISNSINYHGAINYSPQYLQGYYKYNTGSINGSGIDPVSQGSAEVILTRYNGISNDTISTGTFTFDSTSTYIPFQVILSPTSSIADSIIISITNSKYKTGFSCYGEICHLLYLDDLTLSSTPLAVQNISSDDLVISAYPNPTSDLINLKANTKLLGSIFNIYDNTGRVMMSGKIASENTTVNLNNFSDGVYLFRVGEHLKQTFKIIKE
jgi:hypothetical protein